MAGTVESLLERPSLESATRTLHVVVVDEELPWPLTSGKRIRTMGLIERLARRHRITWVCHRNADRDEARRAEARFAELGIRTVMVERTVPPKSGPAFYARLAANLFSRLPYSVASHTSKPLVQALERIAETESVDLWHCEWTPYARALESIAGRRLVMAHNVESVIWQRYHETERHPLKRWYIKQQWKKFARFEKEALGKADLTVAVSELDADRFRADFDVPNVEVVSNGVDTVFFRPAESPIPREPATLLFLGSLDWRPNLDGIEQMLSRVWHELKQRVPEAKLLLVGRNPPESLAARVANCPGIELHASVPDVRPYLHRAGMLVVPLRIGGGSRLKILEALACETPVVSTRVGAEGLHLESGRHLIETNEIEDLAEALVGAIRDPQRMQEQGRAGRRQVERLYDWEVLSRRLERLWLSCVES